MRSLCWTANKLARLARQATANAANEPCAEQMARLDSWNAVRACGWRGNPEIENREKQVQVALLRDVAGTPPFQRVAFDPRCRTAEVVGCTKGIIDGRCFAALPRLADAIETAGCQDGELLAHLRSDGPHTRGCWALDSVLGVA
jgi:hypothetical protein